MRIPLSKMKNIYNLEKTSIDGKSQRNIGNQDDLLSDKLKNYINVFLVSNNNNNFKGNNNIYITNKIKINNNYNTIRNFKRNNTETVNNCYSREFINDFEDVGEQ